MQNDFCAIDFGTSNSALAYVDAKTGAPIDAPRTVIRLAELEAGFTSVPTAVFYNADDGSREFGRAAVRAYVDGADGRLLRSIKSILGTDLMDETTEIAPGFSVRYLDVVIGYLRRLKTVAEARTGRTFSRVMLGRPVYFVDAEPARDARAQATLADAARAAGFAAVDFQFEPIAAALDYEATIDHEQLVLIADIGGGTSDFSLLRADPARHAAADRRGDILANHGVHVAGTDFDRNVSLAAIMPTLGFHAAGTGGRRVPSRIYFDLATWHLINTTYGHRRLSEIRQLRPMYADTRLYARLLGVLHRRLGHYLADRAEQAKITVAQHGRTRIDLGAVDEGLVVDFDRHAQVEALATQIERIVAAALETARRAGVACDRVDAVYFTGGSTGLADLATAIGAQFPAARRVAGDRFASVVRGLAIDARRRFA